jgi:hypothetical protein
MREFVYKARFSVLKTKSLALTTLPEIMFAQYLMLYVRVL